MKVRTGEKDLLGSETFLAPGSGETVISIGEGREALSFVLDFVDSDDDKKDATIGWEDKTTLKVTLSN